MASIAASSDKIVPLLFAESQKDPLSTMEKTFESSDIAERILSFLPLSEAASSSLASRKIRLCINIASVLHEVIKTNCPSFPLAAYSESRVEAVKSAYRDFLLKNHLKGSTHFNQPGEFLYDYLRRRGLVEDPYAPHVLPSIPTDSFEGLYGMRMDSVWVYRSGKDNTLEVVSLDPYVDDFSMFNKSPIPSRAPLSISLYKAFEFVIKKLNLYASYRTKMHSTEKDLSKNMLTAIGLELEYYYGEEAGLYSDKKDVFTRDHKLTELLAQTRYSNPDLLPVRLGYGRGHSSISRDDASLMVAILQALMDKGIIYAYGTRVGYWAAY